MAKTLNAIRQTKKTILRYWLAPHASSASIWQNFGQEKEQFLIEYLK